MPILGADMTEGTLVAWRKAVGERVRRGDVIAEVETDKGLIDVEVFTSGVIEKLLVQPGETVPTGAVLALIQEEAGAPAAAPASPAAAGALAPATAAGALAAPRARISPAARRRAEQLGVAVPAVRGTGPDGAITIEDVERAAATGPIAAGRPTAAVPARPRVEMDRSARIRQAIAAAMARSKREIPHYYLSATIDMHCAVSWLAEQNLALPVPDRLLHGALLIKAVALALREVPELNAVWRGAEVARSDAVHVGVAIALRGGGVVAPALHDADRRPLGELMRGLRDLVRRARAGEFRSSELSDPTITVTSLGEQGVEAVFGVIHPPQVALVGFGRVGEQPWAEQGLVGVRRVVTATLSADHRASDGQRGARFLNALAARLGDPETL
jgi:pyruvate dehydrogenase E2 component (dihydrolipoamide acetyltransferase)